MIPCNVPKASTDCCDATGGMSVDDVDAGLGGSTHIITIQSIMYESTRRFGNCTGKGILKYCLESSRSP